MRVGESVGRLAALTGLVIVLVACGQDHDEDHGHAHEDDTAHTHNGAPETEAFYPEENDTARDTGIPTGESVEKGTQTDEHAHDHGDGETHAH